MSSNESFSERYGTLIAICFASIQLSIAFVISIVSAFHVRKCYANERAQALVTEMAQSNLVKSKFPGDTERVQAPKGWQGARSMSSTASAEHIDVIIAADGGREDNDAKDTVHPFAGCTI